MIFNIGQLVIGPRNIESIIRERIVSSGTLGPEGINMYLVQDVSAQGNDGQSWVEEILLEEK